MRGFRGPGCRSSPKPEAQILPCLFCSLAHHGALVRHVTIHTQQPQTEATVPLGPLPRTLI